MRAKERLRHALRRKRWWLEFQEVNREGWRRAWQRYRMQGRILSTPPVRTSRGGPVEVRALTWRRDWMNLLWALKSFYHFAGVDYPLYIHDGGLTLRQAERLKRHFPDAHLISLTQADATVVAALQERGYCRSLEYRKKNVSTRKLFDFFLLSRADRIICMDSDIVFFRRPGELLVGAESSRNLYNKDCEYWYSLSLEEIEASFGIRPPPLINSGLALVTRKSIDFGMIETFLQHPKLFENSWVTEQTLHALCSSLYGVELLPKSYFVSTSSGFPPNVVCKHYPGFFRPLLYSEGMTRLVKSNFLEALRMRQ